MQSIRTRSIAMLSGIALGASILASSLTGCRSTAPSTESEARDRVEEARITVDRFIERSGSVSRWRDASYGYAVFPSISKGGIGIGGASGRGVVFERGDVIGYTRLSQATIGFQLGGQTFSQIIFFEDKAALDRFTEGNFEFQAGVSAVALEAGAGGAVDYRDGVAVFVLVNTGLMYEASVGGQKFNFVPTYN